MKRDILESVEIPQEMNFEVNGSEVTIKFRGKEMKRKFDLHDIIIKKDNNQIKIESKKATKRESKLIGTAIAHIKNIIAGMQEDFVYKMEICHVHFPMTAKVEGNKVVIRVFLGEAIERIAKILPGVKVEIKGNEITITSHDKELAGQTAANIEMATKIKYRDRRVFQDGIYITEKCGKKI